MAPSNERMLAGIAAAAVSLGVAQLVGIPFNARADARSAMTAESLAQSALLTTADHHEGLAAARERREPVFTGR